MSRDELRSAVENDYVEWQRHTLERMLQRGISRKAVRNVLMSGEIIEDYTDDKPYPSALLLGWVESKALHVVVAFDSESGYCFVITAYNPDLKHFESDYKTRRQHGN